MSDKIKLSVYRKLDGAIHVTLEVPLSPHKTMNIRIDRGLNRINVSDAYSMTSDEFVKYEEAISLAKQISGWDMSVYEEKPNTKMEEK